MKTWTLALGLVALALVGTASAADPSGTWKWTAMRGDQTIEQTLTLKLEGDKLTGSIRRGDQDIAIGDASFKEDTVSFTITRERNGNKFVTKYNGKLSGDEIKGKTESERDGQKQERDWVAKRAK